MTHELFTRLFARGRGVRLTISRRAPWWLMRRLVGLGSRALGLGILIALAGCGGQPASETSTSVPGSPTVSTNDVVATPVARQTADDESSAPGSEEATVTLGSLADRINAQWADFSRFREISTFTAEGARSLPGTTVAASPVSQRAGRSVRQVILPDRARYLAEENGQLVFEFVVIGDQVFARGTVARLLDPTAGPTEWIVTDIATIARSPMLGESAAGQLARLAPPSYVVPERLRPQPVRDLESTQFEGTECDLFGAADTTNTGARIDFTVAIDAEDRLCFLETRSPGISSRYVVEQLDPSVTIEPPASFRPIASPAGSPAANGTPIDARSPIATP